MPGLAPSLLAAVPELASSCRRAVATLADVDHVLLLTSGPPLRDDAPGTRGETVLHPPGSAVSSAPLADSRGHRHFHGPLGGGRSVVAPDRTAGVGVIVGTALLAGAGLVTPTTAVQVGTDPIAPEALLSGLTGRIGLLLIADGSSARGADSPSGGHPDAAAFDRDLAVCLAGGDPARLGEIAASDRAIAVGFASGPAVAAFAALTNGLGPASADLLFDGAPFGVGYFCATWSWR